MTRSAMSEEVIAFSDIFDTAFALSEELVFILSWRIPVQLLTDSKGLFDYIFNVSRTSEEQNMLEIVAAREGSRNMIISDIGFARSTQKIADGLTKDMSQAQLTKVIVSGKFDVQPEQRIVRT